MAQNNKSLEAHWNATTLHKNNFFWLIGYAVTILATYSAKRYVFVVQGQW